MRRRDGRCTILFPDRPRRFRGQRTIKILLRAAHVLCVALLLGAWAFPATAADRAAALAWTAGSGGCLLLLDLHATAAFLVQVRGLVLLGKLAGLGVLPFLDRGQLALLGVLLVVSVVSSHAPARLRYQVVFGRGRIRGAETPG